MSIYLHSANVKGTYIEVLEGSNGKAITVVELMKLENDDRRAILSLYSYDTLIATVIYHEQASPTLAINATADELTVTTLRHLHKFLGAYIEKREK